MLSATRQELQLQKKRFNNITRGHKLLKDKRDSLIKRFMKLIKETLELRKEVDENYLKTLQNFKIASLSIDDKYIETLSKTSEVNMEVYETVRNIMSVKISEFKITNLGKLTGYSLKETNKEFDLVIEKLGELLEKIIKLIEKENSVRKLAKEIILTRRRVSSLENILIPKVASNIRYIKLKLEENAIEEKSKLIKIRSEVVS